MKTRLLNLWDSVRASYWFIPALMALGSIGLATLLLSIDSRNRFTLADELGWLYAGGPEGARSVLSTVAGSMITVAGVVFSIVIVALVLATQQFGPRLLRNFMRDTGNQIVLGTFIATFIYCLLILRNVRGTEEVSFVPHLSVSLAVVLALVSLAVLIYFIHHVAESIQASNVIASVGRDLEQSIERLFPENEPEETNDNPNEVLLRLNRQKEPIRTRKGGYIRAIDTGALLDAAKNKDLVLHLCCRPGDFIVPEDPLGYILAEEPADEELVETVNEAIILGSRRTLSQDQRLAVNQLVEIAMRALSPGINDPFTAINCIDQLTSALSRFGGRQPAPPYRFDDEGNLRLVLQPVDFPLLLDAAFSPIYNYGRDSGLVTRHLLKSLTVLARHVTDSQARNSVRQQAETIHDVSRKSLPSEFEVDKAGKAYHELLRTLEEP